MSAQRPPPPSTQPSFEVVAATGGYDAHATALLLDAASGLQLTSTEAAEWLAVGITPWAVPAWKKQGFADGREAASYRHAGLGPQDAYWARVDSRSRSAAGSTAAQVEVPAPA